MEGEPNKGGRPSLYTPELIEEICERLETGEPMAQICRDEGMPAARTVRDWIEQKDEVSAAIARARLIGFDAIAVQALEIADTCKYGRKDKLDKDGNVIESTTGDLIERARLQVDTRLKLLAKWDPKRYGDKLALGGADDLPPMQTVTKFKLADLE